jgi:hypothetical protein
MLHAAENTKMDNEVLARKSTHFQASSIDGIVTAVAAAAVAEVEAIAALPLPAESCRQAQAQVGFWKNGWKQRFQVNRIGQSYGQSSHAVVGEPLLRRRSITW